MKTKFLLTLFCLMAGAGLHAQTVTVVNNTDCNLFFRFFSSDDCSASYGSDVQGANGPNTTVFSMFPAIGGANVIWNMTPPNGSDFDGVQIYATDPYFMECAPANNVVVGNACTGWPSTATLTRPCIEVSNCPMTPSYSISWTGTGPNYTLTVN